MRLITTLALLAAATPVAAQTARPSTQVDSTTAPRSFQGGAATFDGLAAVAWKDNVQGIWCAASDDAGVTWNAPARVDMDGGAMTSKFISFGTSEAIQRNGDHIYVIWEDARNTSGGQMGSDNNDIFFNRSIDGGQSFESTDQNLSDVIASGYFRALDQALTIVRENDPSDDQVHVVFSVEDSSTVHCDGGDPTAGPEDVFYTGSVDGGGSFAPPILLTAAAGTGADVDDIAIAASGDRVYVAWVDSRDGCTDDVYFAYSDDQGFNWQPEVPLETTGTGDAFGLTMDADGDKVVVGWQDGPFPQVARIAVSTDGGVSFGAATTVGDYAAGADDVDDFKVALSLGNITYAIVYELGAASNEIYANSSSDDGATFGSDVQLSTAGGGFPRISEGGAEVAIAWSGGASPNPVESAYSADGGSTWSALITVNDTPMSDTDFTEVAYDPVKENVVVAWLDDQGTNDNNNNIMLVGGYSISGPGSATFRNGGTNPASYTASAPLLGENFGATIDVGSTGHALAALVGFQSPLNFTYQGRTILVNIADPGGEQLQLALQAGPMANFVVPVPNDPCLAGLFLATQGVHVGGGLPFELSNAQDLVIGAF